MDGSASRFQVGRIGKAMLKIIKLEIFCAAIVIALLSAPLLNAQQTKQTATAPVPAQIFTSNKEFISNAGYDSLALAVFKKDGKPDDPYNQF